MKKSMKNIIKLDYPSSWWRAKWREALPSGNGKIGAAVYGGIYEETIMLTHEDLWWQSKTPELPDISSKLPEVRALLQDKKAKQADRVLADTLIEKGYNPKGATPLPLGDISLIMPAKNAFKDYARTLNMETGEIKVTWLDGETRYERSLFTSRVDDMIVLEIKKRGLDLINVELSVDLHDKRDTYSYHNIKVSLPTNLDVYTDNNYIFYAACNDDNTDFGAVAKIISKDGKINANKRSIKITEASKVLVLTKVFVKGQRQEQWEILKKQLDNKKADYNQLLTGHIKEHARLFDKMTFDIEASGHKQSNEQLLREAYKGKAPDAVIEKMWAYGRYLIISSSQEGGNPSPLMGLWCGEYDGFWAFNMANENLQMNYWQVLSGNMPELLLPVFDYYERLIDDFRLNAKRLYGCRGIYIPAPTAPDSGIIKSIVPHIIHWTGAAGWIAQHYYDYYLYTNDLKFLKERALPFMKEVALFYEDFFTLGEDGYLISCPSNSPENTPGNYWDGNGMGQAMETTINATMDFAIAKEVLSNLLEGYKIAGIYSKELHKWQEMLKKIPPYQINEDGAVKEWMHPYFEDNYHHRHQSHIYPVFPGTEVTRDNNPELFQAFVTAVKKRLVIGLKEQSGWSLAHMANNYARMGEGDLALECLDILSRSCLLNNFYTTHNDWRNMGIGVDLDWAPFQIDANMGWSAAVQEMLLFSLPGKISVLPALPKRWEKGEVKSMLARGGVEVSIKWDQIKGIVDIILISSQKQLVEVLLPHKIIKVLELNKGKVKEGNKICDILLEAGKENRFKLELDFLKKKNKGTEQRIS